jgi:dephospho-CoA kinase
MQGHTTIIGLAGGSGTGKSTIAAHLVRGGGVHIDADRIGHDLLARDAGVITMVRAAFGGDVAGAGGAVDRRALGRRVFSDPEALRRLGAIVHPAIVRGCAAAVGAAAAAGEPLAVVDAALLLEVEMRVAWDLTIALRCPRPERVRRIMAKGGWSEEEARLRLDSQAHIEKSFYKADAVVDTGRRIEEVLAEVDRVVAARLGGAP